MTGILFATEMEAQPFLDRGVPEGVIVEVAEEMGLEAARIADIEQRLKNSILAAFDDPDSTPTMSRPTRRSWRTTSPASTSKPTSTILPATSETKAARR